MRHWLIVYERMAGRMIRCEEFGDWQAGLRERFRLEEQHGSDRDMEIVLLGGDSLAELSITHSRYFASRCVHCGRLVTRCPDPVCTVRCLHERPVPPAGPERCKGWRHEDGWHFCDPAASHKIMAEDA